MNQRALANILCIRYNVPSPNTNSLIFLRFIDSNQIYQYQELSMIKICRYQKIVIYQYQLISPINFHTNMDFTQLKVIIGKPTQEWTKQDVSKWLKFINLQVYIDEFNKKSIDGSCLKLLDTQDLTQQLGIKSRIICKKILNWLSFGLQQFDKFLTSEQTISIDQSVEQVEQPYIKTQIHSENNSKSQIEIVSLGMKKTKRRKSEWQVLILKRVQGKQNIYYKFKQKNCRIGTDPNCQVLVPGQNVDPFHAHILFCNSGYFLHNLSLDSEIFIKVNSRLLISNEMESEMGSNIFKFYIDSQKRIEIRIIQGKNQNTIYKFPSGQNKIMIGRKLTNDISFSQDNTLSNLHAKITFSDHNWYIEDLATTNGTWLQLNSQLKVYTGLIFKLGTTNHQFQCQLRVIKQGQDQEEIIRYESFDTQVCSKCGQNNKNILFIPCNHCSVCEICVKNLKQCTICSQKIQDYTKIFKS